MMRAWTKRLIFGTALVVLAMVGMAMTKPYRWQLGTNYSGEVVVIFAILICALVGLIGMYYLLNGVRKGCLENNLPRTPKFLTSFTSWLDRDGV